MKRDYTSTPRLMRKLEQPDLAHGPYESRFPIDGLVYGHHGYFDENWVNTNATYKWDYFNILTKPLEEWVGKGNPYFDFMWELPHVVGTDGRPGVYPWFYGPRIIAWHELTEAQVLSIRDKITSLLRGRARPFLDLWFLELHDWMLDSTRGPSLSQVAGDLSLWTANVGSFLNSFSSLSIVNYSPMTNGDRGSPNEQYLERAGGKWEEDMLRWRAKYGHVMELRTDWPDVYNDQALYVWSRTGGWLAIDGETADLLYERAHRMRS
jgi:hypothetical protein